ncbi:MAG: hypothetical protein RXR01_02385 [Thermoproteus sp.]
MSMRAVYVYPKSKFLSFTLAGREYIELIRAAGWIVEEVDEEEWNGEVSVWPTFMHPFFYPSGKLKRGPVVAVDVADSSAISREAVTLLNKFAPFASVPSRYSEMVFKHSGYAGRVFVWHHYLGEKWWSGKPNCGRTFRESGDLHVLYFLLHSGWRKGADVLAKSLRILRDRGVKFVLVLKRLDIEDPLKGPLVKEFKAVEIGERLDEDCLIKLYDDVASGPGVLALPSRGGGFERNGLEALSRGLPVVAPLGGSWTEYFPPELSPLLVRAAAMEPVFTLNKYHVGVGPTADPAEMAEKLLIAPRYVGAVAKAKPMLRARFSKEAVYAQVSRSLIELARYAAR